MSEIEPTSEPTPSSRYEHLMRLVDVLVRNIEVHGKEMDRVVGDHFDDFRADMEADRGYNLSLHRLEQVNTSRHTARFLLETAKKLNDEMQKAEGVIPPEPEEETGADARE